MSTVYNTSENSEQQSHLTIIGTKYETKIYQEYEPPFHEELRAAPSPSTQIRWCFGNYQQYM